VRARQVATFWSLLLYLFLLIPGGKVAAAQERAVLPLAASFDHETSATEPTPYLSQEKPLVAAIAACSGKVRQAPSTQTEPGTGLLSLPLYLLRVLTEGTFRLDSLPLPLCAKPAREGRATRAPPLLTFLALSLAREPLR
jgi:hypothetical protein